MPGKVSDKMSENVSNKMPGNAPDKMSDERKGIRLEMNHIKLKKHLEKHHQNHHEKYPISKEFFPYNHLTISLNKGAIRASQRMAKAPLFLWRNRDLTVERKVIPTYGGGKIELYILTPNRVKGKLPCLIYYHGGGFFLEATHSQYRIAMLYAIYGRCKVVFVRYRLAPDYTFPIPQEDAYAAYKWVIRNVDALGVNAKKIAVAGDSAGGTLTATTSMLAIKRNAPIRPLFQMLIYPWLDSRNISESFRRYTDTPIWNSTLSEKFVPITDPTPEKVPLFLRSPIEADSFVGLPPAYIEIAEFDCLHDDGVFYAEKLREENIPTELYEAKGTMHAFDTKVSAPTSLRMIKNRIWYIRRMFR